MPKLNYKESYPNKSDYQGINPNSAKKISLILGLGFFIDEHENNFLDLQNYDSTHVLLFYSDNRKGGRNFMSSQECSCSN